MIYTNNAPVWIKSGMPIDFVSLPSLHTRLAGQDRYRELVDASSRAFDVASLDLSPETAALMARAQKVSQKVDGYRRDIHRDPHVGLERLHAPEDNELPENTKDYILAQLHQIMGRGRPDHLDINIVDGGHGGFWLDVKLKGDKPSKVTALVADYDALHLGDNESTELDYASQNPGIVHACGHDMHTASLLGFAELLLSGSIQLATGKGLRLVFQDAEEVLGAGATMSGAQYLINAGVLEGIDKMAKWHVYANIEPAFYVSPGTVMGTLNIVDVNLRDTNHPHQRLLAHAKYVMGVEADINSRLAEEPDTLFAIEPILQIHSSHLANAITHSAGFEISFGSDVEVGDAQAVLQAAIDEVSPKFQGNNPAQFSVSPLDDGRFAVRITGKQMHVAVPHLGQNAARVQAHLITTIEKLAQERSINFLLHAQLSQTDETGPLRSEDPKMVYSVRTNLDYERQQAMLRQMADIGDAVDVYGVRVRPQVTLDVPSPNNAPGYTQEFAAALEEHGLTVKPTPEILFGDDYGFYVAYSERTGLGIDFLYYIIGGSRMLKNEDGSDVREPSHHNTGFNPHPGILPHAVISWMVLAGLA